MTERKSVMDTVRSQTSEEKEERKSQYWVNVVVNGKTLDKGIAIDKFNSILAEALRLKMDRGDTQVLKNVTLTLVKKTSDEDRKVQATNLADEIE